MANTYKFSSLVNTKLKEKEEEEKDKTNTSTSNNSTSNTQDEDSKKAETNTAIKTAISPNTSDDALKSKSASEIIKDLDEIKQTLSSPSYIDAPESLNLSKVDVPEKSDEELIEVAKNSLANKYSTKKTSTNQNFAKQIENILASKDTYKKSADEKAFKVEEIYSASKAETEDQALKRGLARSSIVIGQLSQLETAKATELANVLNELQANINSSEQTILELEKEKEDALNNLDVEYAIELEEKLQEVTEDYQKARQDAIDFNNNVNKLEAEYKLKIDNQKIERQKDIAELNEVANKNYLTTQIKEAQYNYLKNYLDSLEKEYALSLLLTNKDFQNILGSKYSELYRYISNK